MKKYIFIALLLLFITNVNSVSAWDAGCSAAGPYSVTTGKLCGEKKLDCNEGDLYSVLTGKLCASPAPDPEEQTNVDSPVGGPTEPAPVVSAPSIQRGLLSISGSDNAFQVQLRAFTKDSTELAVTPSGDMKNSGEDSFECENNLCTSVKHFTLNGKNGSVPDLPKNETLYAFTIEAFGETFTISLPRNGRKIFFDER